MKRSTHRKVKTVYDTAKDDTLIAPSRAVAQEQMAALDIAPPMTCSARLGRSRLRRATVVAVVAD